MGRDIGQRALDGLLPRIIQYESNFTTKNLPFTAPQCFGSIKEKPGYTEIAILKPKFEEWLADAGFTDSSVVLRALKDKDILDNEAGKNTRKRKMPDGTDKISTSSQVVYVLKLEKGTLTMHTTSDEPERVARKRPNVSSFPVQTPLDEFLGE